MWPPYYHRYTQSVNAHLFRMRCMAGMEDWSNLFLLANFTLKSSGFRRFRSSLSFFGKRSLNFSLFMHFFANLSANISLLSLKSASSGSVGPVHNLHNHLSELFCMQFFGLFRCLGFLLRISMRTKHSSCTQVWTECKV